MDLLKQIVEWQVQLTPMQLRERKIQLRDAEASVLRALEEIESNCEILCFE